MIRRFFSSFASFWSGASAQPRPTRVGYLDSGELVLVSETDEAQVISARTVGVIRNVLAINKPEQDQPTNVVGYMLEGKP